MDVAVVRAMVEALGGQVPAEAVRATAAEVLLAQEQKTGILNTVPVVVGNLLIAALRKRRWVEEFGLVMKSIIKMEISGIIGLAI